MAENTFLFYDIETTGLSKCFDQVLQFAAIRTDLELNELSRHEIRIKLNPDVVPSPHAIITHHIGYQAMQQGQNEYEAIGEIHKLLNKPGTLSLGYNTLGFDDEFLRFSFYRNLLTPYTHQYAKQCGRLDIYPMTVLYYLFKHDILNWPYIEDKISLKLENISAENNLMTGAAHDAMVDVEATLKLAKLLKQEEKMWQYACGYFDKKTDIERGDRLPILFETEDKLFRSGVIVNGKIGAANNFMVPVLSLGQHKHYKNQTLWLRLDNANLLTASADNLDEKTRVTRKKMGESELLLPPEERYKKYISDERQNLAKQTTKYLTDNPKLLHEICEYHQHYKYPVVPNVDIDAALYSQPFPTPQEEKLFRNFHAAKPADKLAAAKKFSNPVRYEQALRILARHYPQYLPEQELEEFETYKKAKTIDFRGNAKFTLEELKTNQQELYKTDLNVEQRQLLDELTKIPA
jgi:exodeoxyribonuclease-1